MSNVDITSVPLSDEQILVLFKMRIGLFHKQATGETFVTYRWANQAHDALKKAIAIYVTGGAQ